MVEGRKSWARQWDKPAGFGVLWGGVHRTEEGNATKEGVVAARGIKSGDCADTYQVQLKELILEESEWMALYKYCKACGLGGWQRELI